ncbi:MAG TPA: hypothetical protein VH682_32305 [Gemmataceae bacterium]
MKAVPDHLLHYDGRTSAAKGVLDNSFRVVEEILSKHPLQIVRLHLGDGIKRLSTVLAESESKFAFDADKLAIRIDCVWVFQVLIQTNDRPRQVCIAAEHRIEDFGRRKNIREGGVSAFMFAATVETDGGHEVTGFAGMEDFHRVEDCATLQREWVRCTVEFGIQDAQIEAFEIEAAQIVAVEKDQEVGGKLGETRFIGDIGVRDTVDGGCLRWDRDAGIDAVIAMFLLPVGQDLENADLDNAVILGIGAGSLDVENRQRLV